MTSMIILIILFLISISFQQVINNFSTNQQYINLSKIVTFIIGIGLIYVIIKYLSNNAWFLMSINIKLNHLN
jgi:phosphate starvation-inducible membrane PsiE